MLLAGRSLQGVGAALMSPAALATVMTLFPGPSRGKALGVWSSLAGVGSALGVILGGVLTSEAGWRWVFAINVPIGIALLIAIPLVTVGWQRPDVAGRSLDIPGVRHRVHRVARRRGSRRGRPAVSAGQHVPRTRRSRRCGRPVERSRSRPRRGTSGESRLRPRIQRRGTVRDGLAGGRNRAGSGRPPQELTRAGRQRLGAHSRSASPAATRPR